MSHEKTIEYYTDCHKDYEDAWNIKKNYSLHYGYYDRPDVSHDEAVANMNRKVAEVGRITGDDVVLDAGCGVGGSSIWIARNIGAHVRAISIVPHQVTIAKQNAEREGVAHLISFDVDDYLNTRFGDSTFDVVFGLESVCYAPRKADFVREAHRLLRPGGRIVVADGFLRRQPSSKSERKVLDRFCRGWALPGLAEIDTFVKTMREIGFTDTSVIDITQQTAPSSRRMLNDFCLFLPVAIIQRAFRRRNKVQMDNVWTSYWQFRLLRSFGAYAIAYGTKPR